MSETTQRHFRDNPLVQRLARRTQIAFGHTKFAQDRLRFWAPQEPSQYDGLNRTVDPFGTDAAEIYAAVRAAIHDNNTPPIGDNRQCCFEMSRRDNQRCLVNDLAIGGDLVRKPVQRVGFSFDLKPADVTVDYGDIYPAGSMIQTQFVDDQRIGAGLGMDKQTPIGGLSHIAVSKRF